MMNDCASALATALGYMYCCTHFRNTRFRRVPVGFCEPRRNGKMSKSRRYIRLWLKKLVWTRKIIRVPMTAVVATNEQQTSCGNETFTGDLCSIISKVYLRQVFLGSKQFPSKIITHSYGTCSACTLCAVQT